MTLRELKVSELNHVLPIVRETLKKEEELKKLREKANYLKRQINSLKDSLGTKSIVEEAPGFFATRSDLDKLIEELKTCKKQIKDGEDFISASNLLFEGFSQMFNYDLFNCYQNGGVVEVSELKEDYIYEYAYLIQNSPSLTIYRLINMRPEVMEKVESLLKKFQTASGLQRKKIREYLKLAIKYDKEL